MLINLSPIRMELLITASVSGDKILINDIEMDFSQLPEGAELPAEALSCAWVLGDVRRVNGEIHLTLALPHGVNPPAETRFPAAYDVPMMVTNGPVPLPPYDSPSAVEDEQPLGSEREVVQ